MLTDHFVGVNWYRLPFNGTTDHQFHSLYSLFHLLIETLSRGKTMPSKKKQCTVRMNKLNHDSLMSNARFGYQFYLERPFQSAHSMPFTIINNSHTKWGAIDLRWFYFLFIRNKRHLVKQPIQLCEMSRSCSLDLSAFFMCVLCVCACAQSQCSGVHAIQVIKSPIKNSIDLFHVDINYENVAQCYAHLPYGERARALKVSIPFKQIASSNSVSFICHLHLYKLKAKLANTTHQPKKSSQE